MFQFKKKGLIIGITLLLISVSSFIGFKMFEKNNIINKNTSVTKNAESLQPIQVVENHFKYYNEKNKTGILSTLTERKQSSSSNNDFGFENLKYKKINNISEDFNSSRKENYFKYDDGATNGIKKEDLKFYKVEYTVKYKHNTGPQPSGKYIWWYTLIRKDKDSPWLIDEWGEG